MTRYAGSVSETEYITASIVNGSVLGPISYVVEASDFHSMKHFNNLANFSDDTYLIMDATHLNTAAEKFDGVSAFPISPIWI